MRMAHILAKLAVAAMAVTASTARATARITTAVEIRPLRTDLFFMGDRFTPEYLLYTCLRDHVSTLALSFGCVHAYLSL
jgi:hypothetical protein